MPKSALYTAGVIFAVVSVLYSRALAVHSSDRLQRLIVESAGGITPASRQYRSRRRGKAVEELMREKPGDGERMS